MSHLNLKNFRFEYKSNLKEDPLMIVVLTFFTLLQWHKEWAKSVRIDCFILQESDLLRVIKVIQRCSRTP